MTFALRGTPEVAVVGRPQTQDDIDLDRRLVTLFCTWLVEDRGVHPRSVSVYVYNLRRFFQRSYSYVLGGSTAATQGVARQRAWLGEHLFALERRHMLSHGVHRPKKKPPITLAHFKHWRHCCTSGRHDDITVLAAVTTAFQLLLRVGEFSRPQNCDDGFNRNIHLTRASVTWHSADDGPILKPTRADLEWLKDGDYALLQLGPSKADQLGQKYSSQPVLLPFASDPRVVNAARELARMEIAKPCLGQARAHTPLFTTSARASPARPPSTGAEVWLNRTVLGVYFTEWGKSSTLPSVTGRSCRIGGLCALIEAGCSPAECQRLGRWSSDAFRDYARAAPKGTEAKRRLDIGRTEVTSVTQDVLPVGNHLKGPLIAAPAGSPDRTW